MTEILELENPYKKDFNPWFESYKNGDLEISKHLCGMTINKLTEDEASYILSYTARNSSWINRRLREGERLDLKQILFAEKLNASLNKMPSFNNNFAYRMDSQLNEEVVISWFKKKINCTFNIPYFLSTSKDNWGSNCEIWKIKTLESNSFGKDISNLTQNPLEKEILFKQHSKFRIDNVDSNNMVILSEINQNEQVDFELTGLYHRNIN